MARVPGRLQKRFSAARLPLDCPDADRPPADRRDLIKRPLYLVPNSIVVSRGCPHVCDFCYKDAFFEGGRSFYTQAVDAALGEIDQLPGRHLYFLDDHLFGDRRFASALFEGMRGMGRLWQAAGTVNAILAPDLLEQAADAGLRSLFVGFETLNTTNLHEQRKYQNLRRDYDAVVRRVHDLGVMVNGSFVFEMDADDTSVFARCRCSRPSSANSGGVVQSPSRPTAPWGRMHAEELHDGHHSSVCRGRGVRSRWSCDVGAGEQTTLAHAGSTHARICDRNQRHRAARWCGSSAERVRKLHPWPDASAGA